MKNIAITLIFLLFIIAHFSYAQNSFYYGEKGEKFPLELFSSQNYILTNLTNQEDLARSLNVNKNEILGLKEIIMSNVIRPVDTNSKNKMYWTFINNENTYDFNLKDDNIFYVSPSYISNGKILGLSQFLYVKLKKESDLEILQNLSKKYGVEIVGQYEYMPLWYVLSCNKNSQGNALEIANKLFETGKFNSSQPDLMEDIDYNCANDTYFN